MDEGSDEREVTDVETAVDEKGKMDEGSAGGECVEKVATDEEVAERDEEEATDDEVAERDEEKATDEEVAESDKRDVKTGGEGVAREKGTKGESEVVVEAEDLLAFKARELKVKVGEKPTVVEEIVEETEESGESESEGKESGDNEETEGASKEQTEEADNGGEQDEEEVEHTVDGGEKNVVKVDDEETDDQRTVRRRERIARRKIMEILAAENERKRVEETPEPNEEDEDEIPLIRRPRSARVAMTEEATVQRKRKRNLPKLRRKKRWKLRIGPPRRSSLEKREKEKGSRLLTPKRRRPDKPTATWSSKNPSKFPIKNVRRYPKSSSIKMQGSGYIFTSHYYWRYLYPACNV